MYLRVFIRKRQSKLISSQQQEFIIHGKRERMKQSEGKLEVVSVRLVKEAPLFSQHKINSPKDAVDVVGDLLSEMDREVICILNLKNNGGIINCHFASIGSINGAVAEPRELFKASILSNAVSMIMLHCHPSGELSPSKQDTIITDRLIKLSDLLGISLLDHIIVGCGNKTEYFSFKEKGILPKPNNVYEKDYMDLDFDGQVTEDEKWGAVSRWKIIKVTFSSPYLTRVYCRDGHMLARD